MEKITATRLLGCMIDYFKGWLAQSGPGSDRLPFLIAEMEKLGEMEDLRPFLPPVVETYLPICTTMPTSSHAQPLLNILSKVGQHFFWVASPADYISPAFSEKFAYTQLIGPPIRKMEAPIFASEHIAAGFSIQAPNLFYPPHYHEPIEYYGILAGNARWQLGRNEPAIQPPGSYIFHDINVDHAMETLDEPLLTIWAWVGDIHTFPTISGEDWLT